MVTPVPCQNCNEELNLNKSETHQARHANCLEHTFVLTSFLRNQFVRKSETQESPWGGGRGEGGL